MHETQQAVVLPIAVFFCLSLSAEEAQIKANIDEGRHKCESLSLYEAQCAPYSHNGDSPSLQQEKRPY